ncbi:MAG: DUF4013 domain-containing protein [Haloarculaceae archaeon]
MSGLTGALAYPLSGPATERPLVACWTLVLLAVFVPFLPLIPLAGYLVRVLVASVRGDPAPRLLEGARSLLAAGVVAWGLLVVYLALPAALLLVTVQGALAREGTQASLPTIGIMYAGSTAVLLLSMAGAYLWPLAVAEYSQAGSVRAAFDWSAFRRPATHGGYFVWWIVGAAALAVALALAVRTAAVPRIGPVIAGLLAAYGALLAFHLWGRAIARTL